ncbi:hypothetical protein AM493_05445 [Flavobacterium akiainvivens]|uniref:Uncharacterized protein n=1 Tax=Flavobacterium akiainvivens TaxID=1202724 RepID=A0A0M9VHG4_9FLAO|nr:DUF4097 family beta strand repeat-containing protein [Flavobacterium akiainvivens]KOS05539.1 hypothetical protein AM493_05445 [Flavobacterium akiainvivens]SFQ33879.1 Putative adhesin [Flavobacterium akiainvivens]
MRTILKITLLLLLAPMVALADGKHKGKYTKEKKISKSFNVSATAALDVANKYGAVYVTTWDQNQTAIDVVIKVSGDKQDQIDKRLNSIDVNFEATTAKVAAKTQIGNFSGKVSMEINYTIKIPRKGTTDITNQYGNVILGKMDGRAVLKVQYGNLNIDRLNGSKNEINLQYSDAVSIDYIGLTKINAQYSNLKIQTVGDELILSGEYSEVKLGSVKRLDLKTSYGDIKIDSAQEIIGRATYSDVKIGTLTEMLNYSTSYGDIKVDRITKEAKQVTISGGYSDINVRYDAAWAFDFSAKVTYGDVNGTQNFTIQEKKQASTSSYFKGYHRSSGSAKLTVDSAYGDISLTRL